MKIYIAASWKHKHAVEMLTDRLRTSGHEVISWVEHNEAEGDNDIPFEDWLLTDNANRCFSFDVTAATTSDLVIYIGPSGMDCAAELGMAYASGIPILGLWSKGEQLGLMRKMFSYWATDYRMLLDRVGVLSDMRDLARGM